MARKNISQEKIINSFLYCAFDHSAGGTSLADISDSLQIKKSSLYNHFDNRDAMYEATLEFCQKELGYVSFLQSKTIDTIKTTRTLPSTLFKKLIARYFTLFDGEPFLQMYVFIHTEQYFNYKALQIIKLQRERLYEEVKRILACYVDVDKIDIKTDKELVEYSACIADVIFQELDFYIASRKDVMRKNPETGAGSLFALPTDEAVTEQASKFVEKFLKSIEK